MKKEEKKKQEIENAISNALKHCTSLEDFTKFTRELFPLVELYKEEILQEFHKHEEQFLYKLRKVNYVVNYDNAHVLMFVPNLYLKSLKTNYNRSIKNSLYMFSKVNQYNIGDYIISDMNVLKEYVKIFKEHDFNLYNVKDQFPKFARVALYLASFSKKDNVLPTMAGGEDYYKNMSDKEKKFIYFNCFKKIRDESKPQYVVESDAFLEDRFKSNSELRELVKRILKDNTYNEDDEKAILEKVNVPYENIEDYFDDFLNKNQNNFVNTATFGQKLLLSVYVKKIAKEMGLEECKVNMFDCGLETSGYANKNNLVAFNLRHTIATWKSFLVTIYHELSHLLQYKNVREMNVYKDRDIDLYSKDEIIQTVYGREYYTMNYNRYSLEVDAVYRSELLASKHLNKKEDLFEYYKQLGEKELNENAGYIKKEEIDKEFLNKRYVKINVNGKKQKVSRDLNELFLMALKEITTYKTDKNTKILDNIRKNHPLISYDYELTPSVRRKEVSELIDSLDKSSGKTRDIYKYLLEQRLKKDKNTRLEFKQAHDEISRIRDNSDNEMLKQELTKILGNDIALRVSRVNKNG